jgi:hypothetical protein
MLGNLLNMTVKVQRRSASASPNILNEPDYSAEANYPIIYASAPCRIDYWKAEIKYNESGERENPTNQTILYFNNDIVVYTQDRLTVLTCSDPSQIGLVYKVQHVEAEWDTMGNVNLYAVTIGRL